ncbi:MAG: DUF4190 domain-containing protein [Candidatus Woesearchaeota archaeon]
MAAKNKKKETNILAILSLIFSLIVPFSIVGLVLGIVALANIKKNPEQDGKGLAIAGIVISSLMLLISLALVAMIPFFIISGAKSYVYDYAEQSEVIRDSNVMCDIGARISLNQQEADKPICYDASENMLIVRISNKGNNSVSQVNMNIAGSNSMMFREINKNIDAGEKITLRAEYYADDYGDITHVSLVPVINDGNDNTIICHDAALMITEIPLC